MLDQALVITLHMLNDCSLGGWVRNLVDQNKYKKSLTANCSNCTLGWGMLLISSYLKNGEKQQTYFGHEILPVYFSCEDW